MRKKLRKIISGLSLYFIFFLMSIDASAINPNAPPDVVTTSMDALITIVFWAVRIIIGAAGGIPSIIKVVQGQTDENPRDRNSGIAGLVATGVGIAATFALEAMF